MNTATTVNKSKRGGKAPRDLAIGIKTTYPGRKIPNPLNPFKHETHVKNIEKLILHLTVNTTPPLQKQISEI